MLFPVITNTWGTNGFDDYMLPHEIGIRRAEVKLDLDLKNRNEA